MSDCLDPAVAVKAETVAAIAVVTEAVIAVAIVAETVAAIAAVTGVATGAVRAARVQGKRRPTDRQPKKSRPSNPIDETRRKRTTDTTIAAVTIETTITTGDPDRVRGLVRTRAQDLAPSN